MLVCFKRKLDQVDQPGFCPHDILITGLISLATFGHNSSGVAFAQNGEINVVKRASHPNQLFEYLKQDQDTKKMLLNSHIGIGCTQRVTPHTENVNQPMISSCGSIAAVIEGNMDSTISVFGNKEKKELLEKTFDPNASYFHAIVESLCEPLKNPHEEASQKRLGEIFSGTFGTYKMMVISLLPKPTVVIAVRNNLLFYLENQKGFFASCAHTPFLKHINGEEVKKISSGPKSSTMWTCVQ